VDVRIEELKAEELDRIREIDRSEQVRFKYVYDHGELRAVEINHDVPAWSNRMVAEAKEVLAPKLASGGVLLGALDGDRLVGVAVLGGERIGPDADQRRWPSSTSATDIAAEGSRER
jgi:hypothetical protein